MLNIILLNSKYFVVPQNVQICAAGVSVSYDTFHVYFMFMSTDRSSGRAGLLSCLSPRYTCIYTLGTSMASLPPPLVPCLAWLTNAIQSLGSRPFCAATASPPRQSIFAFHDSHRTWYAYMDCVSSVRQHSQDLPPSLGIAVSLVYLASHPQTPCLIFFFSLVLSSPLPTKLHPSCFSRQST